MRLAGLRIRGGTSSAPAGAKETNMQQALALALPVLGWWLLTGIINLAFGYKSQIEAWAESRPYVAGLLKTCRALGFDPWNVLSAIKLFAQKKLPDAQKADSPVARIEQRKADAKALGGPPDDGAGGTGDGAPPSFGGRPDIGLDAECRALPTWGFTSTSIVVLALVLIAACNRDARPCSAEDLATGPLAAHNASCAARRQASYPNLPDDACDATPGCKAIVAECDAWVESRCR
jgi:hypothetical protein